MVDRKWQDKTLALAGIFQAANLVDSLSTNGQVPEESFAESINSIFQTNPRSVSDVYDAVYQAGLGICALQAALTKPRDKSAARWLAYSIALIRIERAISRHQSLCSLIKARIQHHKQHLAFFDSVTNHNVISKLGSLYLDTAGSSKYRVIVRGRPSLLMYPAQKEKLCAVLFAGIRSAHLWRELGGNQWELMFCKKNILITANAMSSFHRFPASMH